MRVFIQIFITINYYINVTDSFNHYNNYFKIQNELLKSSVE